MLETIRTGIYDSPLGTLTMAYGDEAITGLWIRGQKHFARTLPEGSIKERTPAFARAAEWLDRYFAGERPEMDLLLAPQGTPFQQTVWRLLRTIPYGQTITDGQLALLAAAELGRPAMSARAVGNAVGLNPISILIPCHRVIGAKGELTGYAGGLEAKRFLLTLEGASYRQGVPATQHCRT